MHTPDLASITTLVDLELKRLEDSRREQGWTPWILLAALGTLAWQVAGYLSESPRWHEVALYWALLFVVGLTIESVIDLLNSGDGPRRPGLRYFRATIYSAGRAARVFAAVKVGGAAALLIWLTPFSGLIKVGWIILFGYYVYAVLAHVAGSWTDFPNPVGTMPPPKKPLWIVPVLFWVIHLSLVTSAVVILWSRLVATYNVTDARLALLIFAVAQLTGLLLAYRINEPVRLELLHLRRVIGLREIEAEEARQKFIEIIYGSELSVILRPRFERMEQRLAAAIALLGEAETDMLAAIEGNKPGAEVKERIEQAGDQFDSAETEWMFLSLRVMVCRFIGGLPSDVAARHADLKVRVEAAEGKLKDIRAAAKNLPRGEGNHG